MQIHSISCAYFNLGLVVLWDSYAAMLCAFSIIRLRDSRKNAIASRREASLGQYLARHFFVGSQTSCASATNLWRTLAREGIGARM
jgi:hypothetical protein